MHAKTHTNLATLSPNIQHLLRSLFSERLNEAIKLYKPNAILALGADCEKETLNALNVVELGSVVPLTNYNSRFGKVAGRYERPIKMFSPTDISQGAAIFSRNAPFTNWHRPNRSGIYETGKCLRAVLSNT